MLKPLLRLAIVDGCVSPLLSLKSLKNASFSRHFCSSQFSWKFRSWKRQKESRSVESARADGARRLNCDLRSTARLAPQIGSDRGSPGRSRSMLCRLRPAELEPAFCRQSLDPLGRARACGCIQLAQLPQLVWSLALLAAASLPRWKWPCDSAVLKAFDRSRSSSSPSFRGIAKPSSMSRLYSMTTL
jgi:hypothetical protein